MTTDDNVLSMLMNGLPRDDQISLLRSIQDTREMQIEQVRHPRRRRRRNEDGVLEAPVDDSAVDEAGPAELDG
jgi:hypothetical protein